MRTKKSSNILVRSILSGLMLLCLWATEGFCVDWVLFSTFKNGDLLYYDRDSIYKNSTNGVKIRTKLEYSKRGLEEDKKSMVESGMSEAELIRTGHDRLRSTIILWELRCRDKVSCMLTFTDYDRNEKVLFSRNVPAIESCDPITPKAPQIHSLFEMMCNKQTAMKQ